jgi:hypothetical protein
MRPFRWTGLAGAILLFVAPTAGYAPPLPEINRVAVPPPGDGPGNKVDIEKPKIPPPDDPNLSPSKPDPRCEGLTEEQRHSTPGCQ